MDQASSLVARAHAALARVAGARAKALARAWRRQPWTVGIALGEGSTRAALFEQLYGDKALGTFDRVPGGPALRVRRGQRARFRAQRVDGRKEEHALGEPSEDPRVFTTRV